MPGSPNPGGPGIAPGTGTPPGQPGGRPDPIREELARMTPDEKIGQMVLVGLDGYTVDEHAASLIQTDHVGGFILYKNNIQNVSQLAALLNRLKSDNAGNPAPLFLSVDEEGGRVSRMPDEVHKLPASAVIGRRNDTDLSRAVGGVMAEELRAFGFNTDFAPVLDINSNPDNPVIGDRSFGSTPDAASRQGVAEMRGIQDGGIISVVKHFPGHGDTSVDSHLGLPRVDHDLGRLRSFELAPFRQAIQSGAEAVMVAHILFPKIDPAHPASMSPAFMTDLLRREMHFDGVIMTDDLTMGAIVQNDDIGRAAVQAVRAGADLVLVGHDYDKETAVIRALQRAAQDGTLPAARIDDSVCRILQLKHKYRLSDAPVNPPDVTRLNRDIDRVLGRIG
ncbi:glycoside hydrolase family 3 domain protein [Kyrpidia tusciae DSM 2912]|uniref:Glycoside hydrolase family 3 domain protein n=1 Tax=Kyrpidia tusciae (strain DSM 2912 / NBRC 15312 / T2) TaxID=562970 RepID=D5WU87_KYRT2|nr:glycoside hydrolase family 3 domain protein [Kyrpidia tusciae DSM 2912]